MAQTIAAFGSWRSPITSDLIVSGTIGLSEVQLDGDETYWIESRPTEAGRNVIVRMTANGQMTDLNPQPFNARTTVHEYGGGAYLAVSGSVFFSNFADQRLYRIEAGNPPVPITPTVNIRFADAIIDHRRGRLIRVQEDHRTTGAEAINTLVDIDVKGAREIRGLVSGANFYSSPRLSTDGTQLAWLSWKHPNMPWFGTELWLAGVATDGSLVSPRLIAGGATESIFQPEWSPNGTLYFVSDGSGWWNLSAFANGVSRNIAPMAAEFGQAQWTFGLSLYAFLAENQVVCSFTKKGIWNLSFLEPQTGQFTPSGISGSDFAYVRANAQRVVVRTGSPDTPYAVTEMNVKTGLSKVLKQSAPTPNSTIRPFISVPTPVEFKTANGVTAHAFLYKPTNPDFTAPVDELPPLLVKSHGGPTAATSSTLDFRIQYWTSRGFAVLDVNYGGSTGYGREYRDRLKGKWGIVDVDDCANGAESIAAQGIVDVKRLLITGGSAGGYTTLCALTFRKVFSGGASYYGISDLEALARDTHKFESHYMEWLVAPYPAGKQVYYERSPVHFATKLSVPVIFFQGEEDKCPYPRTRQN